MKRLLLSLCSSTLLFGTAYAAPQMVGFIDNFDVTITASVVSPIITFIPQGHSGGIVAQDYYCDSNGKTCHFETTDNYSGLNGKVEFLIGVNNPDSTLNYCDIKIEDGAFLVGGATMTSTCYPQGAVATTEMERSGRDYSFDIEDAH